MDAFSEENINMASENMTDFYNEASAEITEDASAMFNEINDFINQKFKEY